LEQVEVALILFGNDQLDAQFTRRLLNRFGTRLARRAMKQSDDFHALGLQQAGSQPAVEASAE
jgi:hypothetical protein